MSIKEATPYIFCNGTAAQALKLYERALGAKVESVMRYGDVPDAKAAPEDAGRVMHALLRVGEAKIMASDTPAGQPAPPESNVWITLDFTDLPEMTRAFEALAAGGKVTMALHDAFWGATFGMVVDAHGIGWMFVCDKKR